MSTHYFTVTIPVKKYVKKYLMHMYGETILLNLETDIGFMMLMAISSSLESKMSRGYIDMWQKRYVEKMVFRIPYHYFSISRKKISPYTYVVINRMFETIFETDMYRFVFYRSQLGYNTKESIELFCNTVGIDLELDITFEALKKQEYRLRKKILKNSCRNLSRNKTLFG